MNKNQFRIIFNRARGIMMAVAENVTAHSSSTSASFTDKATKTSTGDQTAIIRPLAFSILLALGMVGVLPNTFSVNTAHADIIADTAAATNQRPMVINAANGVPLVNIQTPSSAGVSRNTYSQFDVSQQGVILNNSRTNVQTQLGGFVQGNPYLAAGTARIILNEVNSSNPSLLNGYIEVAGSRAQVIIANPAGISCSGCGFINTSVATLTTGTPLFGVGLNSGDLMGYRVGGGVIAFLGAGLDASQTDYTNVLARAVSVNAGIWANNLNIVTGSNQVNVASNGTVTGIGAITPDAGDATPAFAVDVAALGGMYAGKIHLIGTEAGLGVRNAGEIGASAGEVTIDVNGNLTNSNTIAASNHTTIQANHITNTGGTITAGQQLAINAASLTGDGSVLAGADANITLSSDYTHTSAAALQAGGNLTLSTTGNISNQSALLAGNTLTLNAANIDNTATGEISGLNTHINTTQGGVGRLGTGTLTNRGLIDGSDTLITAATLNNIGTGSIFGDHIAIAANTLNNANETLINASNGASTTTAAIIAARSRMDIGSQSINNVNGSLLFSAGDIPIGGSLDANHHATVSASQIPVQGNAQAATLINQGATIEALGNLSANVADLQNLNAGITSQLVVDSSQLIQEVQPEGWARRYDVSRFPTIFNYNIEGQYFIYDDGIARPAFEDYSFFNYTETVRSTQVLTSKPAQLVSGGNMILAGNITNSDSKVIAGGALDVTGATLNNLNTQGQVVASYSGWVQFRDWDGDDEELEFGRQNAFNPANNVTTFNLSTTQLAQNTSPASVGATSNTTVATLNNNALPANSLFTPSTNVAASYFIETNPRFANYKTWLSSDYMLAQLSYDPATQTKRLGDGFYEQRLIREQVNQLTGQRFLAGYASDEAQYQALMVNGVTFAKAFNLTPGIALTDAQMVLLTSDIVWLVGKEVTLPDGSKTIALIPQVYAKLRDGDLQNTGALLAGDSVKLSLNGNVNYTGSLGSRTLLAINANNIQNLGGLMSGRDVRLDAAQDINNIGGIITAQDSLALNAGRDINVVSTTQSAQNTIGASSFSRTNLDRIAGLYVTGGQGILAVVAGNDINLNAADIGNAATNANSHTLLSAGNDITLGTVQIAEQNNSIENSKRFNKSGSTTEIGTQINTAGDVTLLAGNDLSARAAKITSESGTLTGVADNNITIESGEATYNSSIGQHKKKSSGLSSKKTTQIDSFADSASIASSLSADQIKLVAGAVVREDGRVSTLPSPVMLSAAKNPVLGNSGNLSITGSNIVATNDVNLNASNNITIESAQDTHTESHYKKVKQSGLSSSGASVTYGKSSLKTTNDTQTTTNVASTVGSVAGDVNINADLAGNTGIYTQTASDVLTPAGNINITAQQVNIVAGTDTYANQQTMKYKQSGITVGISSAIVSAAQNVEQELKNAKDSQGVTRRLGSLIAAAEDMVKVASAPTAIKEAFAKNGVEGLASATGVSLNISIGTNKSSSKNTTSNATVASSTLVASGDVNITAMGANEKSDINVIGSQISAKDTVMLKADDVINLVAAKNIIEQHSSNKSSSASLGLSIGVTANGIGVSANASASQARGKADGIDVIYTNTHIDAGSTLNLQSGGDTNLKGAVASGNKVIANIGRDFNLESLQDTSTYKSKKTSAGFNISVPIYGAGLVDVGLNASRGRATGDYASVTEQTGIDAGIQGFIITTQKNTDLKGAIIASEASTDKNQLNTGTLTYSAIQNLTEATAKSDGINLNQDLFSKYGAVRTLASSAHMHQNESESRSSTTQSAIEQGDVNITSNPANAAQVASAENLTVVAMNKNISEDNALTISRDTQNANQPLVKIDAQDLEQQVVIKAQQYAADVGLVTKFSDDIYRVMFREPPRFYKAVCPAQTDCVKDPQKVRHEELKGTPAEIQAQMKNNPDQNKVLAVNGIFNGVDRAIELAFQNAENINKTEQNPDGNKPTTIYLMHYKPSNSQIGEGLVALYEQKLAASLGYTNSDIGYALAIQGFGQGKFISLGHSRGTLVQNNAFNILNVEGFTNPNLIVRAVAGALPVGDYTSAAMGVIGDKQKIDNITFNYYGNDPVSTQSWIGGNEGFSTLRDLWTVLTGGNNTQHSCYGTGAAGCVQVEIPTERGYQGQAGWENTLYEWRGGVLRSNPNNPNQK